MFWKLFWFRRQKVCSVSSWTFSGCPVVLHVVGGYCDAAEVAIGKSWAWRDGTVGAKMMQDMDGEVHLGHGLVAVIAHDV